MRESIKNRAAAIRHYLSQTDLAAGPATTYGYSLTAAQWESLRLLIETGKGTPADDRRLAELGRVLKTLTKQMGLGDDLTDSRGFLVRDPQRLMYDTWQEAAEGWTA
jgi:hypothetical protein